MKERNLFTPLLLREILRIGRTSMTLEMFASFSKSLLNRMSRQRRDGDDDDETSQIVITLIFSLNSVKCFPLYLTFESEIYKFRFIYLNLCLLILYSYFRFVFCFVIVTVLNSMDGRDEWNSDSFYFACRFVFFFSGLFLF